MADDSGFELYGPRPVSPPSMLSLARRVGDWERRVRTNTGPTFFGRTWRTGEDISARMQDYPTPSWASEHQGRGAAEVARDELFSTLTGARSTYAPSTQPTFLGYMGSQLGGYIRRGHEMLRSFMNRRY